MTACIAEPLIAMASYRFFNDIGRPVREGILDLMGSSKFSPSSCGLFFELYLIPAVVTYFSKNGVTLDQVCILISLSLILLVNLLSLQHEYIQSNFKDNIATNPALSWLKGASLVAPNIERGTGGMVNVLLWVY